MADVLKRSLRVPGDAPVYIEALRIMAGRLPEHRDIIVYFVPRVSGDTIVAQFAEYVSKEQFGSDHVQMLPALTADIGATWKWEALLGAIEQRLLAGAGASPAEVRLLLDCVRALRDNVNVRRRCDTMVTTLAKAGHLLSHLHSAHAANDVAVAARCMIMLVIYLPTGSVTAHVGQSQAGLEWYREMLEAPDQNTEHIEAATTTMCDYGATEQVLKSYQAVRDVRKLVGAIVRMVAERSDAAEVLSAKVTVGHFETISDCLTDEAVMDLLKELAKEGALFEEMLGQEFDTDSAGLYRTVLMAVGDVPETYHKFMAVGLRGMSRDAWEEELENEGDAVGLVLGLGERGSTVGLGAVFYDALRTHSRAVRKTGELPSEYEEKWRNLPKALEDDLEESFWRDMRDDLLSEAEGPIAPLVTLYGQGLIESGVLEDKADEVVRRLFGAMVDRGDGSELGWMVEIAKRQPRVLEKSKTASRQLLGRRVQEAMEKEGVSEEALAHLDSMRDMLSEEGNEKA